MQTSSLSSINKLIIPSTPLPFFTAYGPKMAVEVHCLPGFGRTKQSFKAEADINNILARYQKTGVLDFANKHEGSYGDVIGADFQEAMNIITKANSMFADMPGSIRARFDNDPAKFLDFVQDERNREEATELGLLKPTGAPPVIPKGTVASPPAAEPLESTGEPQNRTGDGRFTFDQPPSGPEGDAPTPKRRR